VLELPWSTPPVKPNGGHGNIYAHARKVKQARQVMGLLARQAKLPRLGRCEVLLTWHVGDRIARDADNLAWTLKPLCDALSSGKGPWDHPIVQDDTPEYMVKHMPAVSYVKGQPKRMTLTVRELPCP
jgi:crossover junction endodeoxyribonuclease RusA